MTTDSDRTILKRDFITSLAKGLEVLRAFDEHNPKMSVSDLAQKLDISRASARRFLLTLEDLGYLSKAGQRYQLTSKVLGLGVSYFASMPLSAIAQPHLERVTRDAEESCSMGVLDNDMLVFVARAQSRWIMNIGLNVGTQLPAYCTAMGRVLLASMSIDFQKRYLSEQTIKSFNERTITSKKELMDNFATVKKQGYSIVDQELEQGLRAIAVPVFRAGEVVASISISSQVNRASIKRLKKEFLPLLREAAAAISNETKHKD